MKVEITPNEISILKDYQKHLWKLNQTSFSLREILMIILAENRDELRMVQRDLEIENRTKK